MTQTLRAGARVRTRYGEARVLGLIGGGSQGDVYTVVYNGERKALKWYHSGVFLDRDEFIRNLQTNIDRGAPSAEFLWPIDRTDPDAEGCFGYVMDLCPEGFVEAGDLFIYPGMFLSFKRVVDVCLHIAHAFGILHDAGYVYRDISGGNFFVEPSSGRVLICDNDNVAPANKDTGIRGTPRFMAPEVVRTNASPTERCDRHSLAVIIFMLLLMQHPLEGKRLSSQGGLDAAAQRSLYGNDALFVFDPHDHANAIEDPTNNARMLWPHLPAHMRGLFERAFSREALREGRGRPNENEWVRHLVRLRSELVRCPYCGQNELFLADAKGRRCDNPACGVYVRTPLRAELSLGGYALPVADDMRIYACQTRLAGSARDALDTIAWVLAPDAGEGELGVLNMSNRSWYVDADGSRVQVAPQMTALARAGYDLHIGEQIVSIRHNA